MGEGRGKKRRGREKEGEGREKEGEGKREGRRGEGPLPTAFWTNRTLGVTYILAAGSRTQSSQGQGQISSKRNPLRGVTIMHMLCLSFDEA